MTTPTTDTESAEMAALRASHKAFREARHNIMTMHLGLVHTPSIDRTAAIAALNILEDLHDQLVVQYGKLCLARDIGPRPGGV